MYNKKGDYGLPIYFTPALVLFILVLFIFSFLFFAADLINSPNLIIKSQTYQDSGKLMVMLRSQVTIDNNNITIAELVSLAQDNPKYKESLNTELNRLLLKLPKPPRKEELSEVSFLTPSSVKSSLQKANWNLDIVIQEQTLHLGEEQTLGTNYFLQSTVIPISNNRTAKLSLYLDCFSCSKEGIDAIA